MSTLTPTPTSQRPDRGQPGRYPAGRAIGVVLLALLFGALLDADSLVAAVSSERFGTARSIELALVRPFKTVSDAVGLNLPHRWLADIGGTNQHHLSPVVLPQPEGESAAGLPATASSDSPLIGPGPLFRHRPLTPTTAAQHSPAAAPPPAPVRVVTPTAAVPVKVWLAGDSMIGELADAFLAHVAGNRAVTASENMQIGTGLARPDVYDWPGTIAKEVQEAQPNIVVLTFGANDDQDMMAGSRYLVRATPAWQAEYARRVSLVMSAVAGSGRMLIWMEMPPMARPRLQQTDQIINGILRTQAKAHPGVVLVDPGPVLAPSGSFASYLPGSSGAQVQVRSADGVHLTPAGAGRVLPLLLAAIQTHWRVN
jgi:lysophospholipase L1-like esterase